MSHPSQNISKKEYSAADPGQILKDVHISEANALKVINGNCLVPDEFTKITLDYVTSGNGVGEIQKVYYWNSGVLQESMAVVRGDQQPVSEITLLLFHSGLNAFFLSQKAFKIYDSVGSVGIYYAVDGDLTVPNLGTNRLIKIDILSSDNIQTIASKTQTTINGDSEFVASYTQGRVLITSVTTGQKINAEDINSTIIIQVTQEGVEDQSLFGKYFWIYTPTEKKHIWYSDGTTVDPNPATTTGGIEIVLVENESRDNVLIKTVNQVNEKSTDFFAYLQNKQLLIRSNRPGITNEIEDGNTEFMFFTNLFGESQRIIRTIELTYDIRSNITQVISY